MIKDYHMHPMVVQKPEQFDLFVQKAVAEGIEEICISIIYCYTACIGYSYIRGIWMGQ